MSIFAVTYTYRDAADLVDQHRPAHRAYMAELAHQGKLMGSGPFTDREGAGALVVLSAADRSEVQALLSRDPFVVHGVVIEHVIREWSVNTGPWA